MKIVKLTAENVKKLRAVEITPKGEVVEITGRNGQGKTSVLDSIWWALAGTKHIQAVPIRKGADKARIRLDLGELIVERRFTAKGSSLTVENAEGARYQSPQGMLDALLGALTFDPLAFVSQEPRSQFETLRSLVKLDVDVDKLDALNRGDFDRRTDVNREARIARAQAEGIAGPSGLPPARIDVGDLMRRIEEAAGINAEIEGRRARRESAAREIQILQDRAAGTTDRAAQLREEADALDQQAAGFSEQARALMAKLDAAAPLPKLVPIGALRAEIDRATVVNRTLDQREQRTRWEQAAEKAEDESKALTLAMEARAAAKANAIAAAAMPVEGLGFGDGVVTFGGIPFDQASSAEQLRVSVALAMAANPTLRVIRIKEGALLDEANVALIAEMARARDYQVWLETVDTSGKVGIVIEDGSVVSVDGEPVGAPGETS